MILDLVRYDFLKRRKGEQEGRRITDAIVEKENNLPRGAIDDYKRTNKNGIQHPISEKRLNLLATYFCVNPRFLSGESSCMTASDMFESIGYRKVDYNSPHTNEIPYFEWVSEQDDDRERIRFVPNAKRLYVWSTYNMHPIPSPLSLEEIKAIELQCIELGWKV